MVNAVDHTAKGKKMWPSFITFLLMGVMFFAFSRAIPQLNKETPGTKGTGEITKIIQEDGLVFFYVNLWDGDELQQGISGYYSDTKNKYRVGDTVPITYFQDARRGNYHVNILDDDLIQAGEGSVPAAARVCTILAVVCGVLAMYCLVKSL